MMGVLFLCQLQLEDRADADHHFGRIAQEVAEVLPDLVTRAADAGVPRAMNYVELVPILVRAILKQQDQIRSLQTRVAADD